MAVDPRWRENQEVARAASGSANELVPALARIIETGAWREFVHPMRGLTVYEHFTDYCREFLELEAVAVEALCSTASTRVAADEVRRLIREDTGPANDPRENRVSNANPQKKQDAAAMLARLKRDDPALADQVVAGDISPNAAAIKAGIRKPRAQFRTDDVGLAVAALLKHFTAEQIVSAVNQQGRESNE